MKLSVSLAPEDVVVLDEFVRSAGLRSRSSGLQHAVRLLRHPQLEQDYAAAWAEWDDSGDSAGWEPTAADGFPDAER